MPSRFTSGAYEPELVNEMSDAFECAWSDFAPRPKDERLAKWLMATAIIEAVERGTRGHENLVRRATVALRRPSRQIRKLWFSRAAETIASFEENIFDA